MKALSVITLFTLLSISCAHEAKSQSLPNSNSDTIVPAFLKQEEAALLLQKEDEHIRRWSSFDLASHTVGIEGGKQGYLQFAGHKPVIGMTRKRLYFRNHLNPSIRLSVKKS